MCVQYTASGSYASTPLYGILTTSVVWFVVNHACVPLQENVATDTHNERELFNCGQCHGRKSTNCGVFPCSISTTHHVTCACTLLLISGQCVVRVSWHVSHWYFVLCCSVCMCFKLGVLMNG